MVIISSKLRLSILLGWRRRLVACGPTLRANANRTGRSLEWRSRKKIQFNSGAGQPGLVKPADEGRWPARRAARVARRRTLGSAGGRAAVVVVRTLPSSGPKCDGDKTTSWRRSRADLVAGCGQMGGRPRQRRTASGRHQMGRPLGETRARRAGAYGAAKTGAKWAHGPSGVINRVREVPPIELALSSPHGRGRQAAGAFERARVAPDTAHGGWRWWGRRQRLDKHWPRATLGGALEPRSANQLSRFSWAARELPAAPRGDDPSGETWHGVAVTRAHSLILILWPGARRELVRSAWGPGGWYPSGSGLWGAFECARRAAAKRQEQVLVCRRGRVAIAER